MASTKKMTNPTFKERWDDDLKWRFMVAVFAVPGTIAALIFASIVIDMYTGWFYTY